MNLNPTFDRGKGRDMTGWYYFDSAFNKEEIAKIKKEASVIPISRGQVAANFEDEALNQVRKSNIKWIPRANPHGWLYDRLMNYMTIANDNMWQFDLQSIQDSIQYTQYEATEKGFYNWHMDIGPNELAFRKISLVVQLSDPNDYQGGELEIRSGSGEATASKAQGTVIIFPSYLLHRVTPVTSGVRESLVLWAGGNSYK